MLCEALLKLLRLLKLYMERTNIPVSKSTRRELRIEKAKKECDSYDELLQEFLEDGGGSA